MDYKIALKTGELNQALFNVTHGLYILTTNLSGRMNGQCLDALMQVTSVPPRIAIGVNKKNLTHDMIVESGVFAVNLLDRSDTAWMDKVKHFGFQSGRDVDKFSSTNFSVGKFGIPILTGSKVFYECKIIPEKTIDLDTHTVFTGLVEQAGTSGEPDPVTYNEYRRLKMSPNKLL